MSYVTETETVSCVDPDCELGVQIVELREGEAYPEECPCGAEWDWETAEVATEEDHR